MEPWNSTRLSKVSGNARHARLSGRGQGLSWAGKEGCDLQLALHGDHPRNPLMSSAALLLKRTEVAALLGVSPSSVDRLERSGALPQRRRLGGAARWLRAEIEAALAALPAGADSSRTQAARAARRQR